MSVLNTASGILDALIQYHIESILPLIIGGVILFVMIILLYKEFIQTGANPEIQAKRSRQRHLILFSLIAILLLLVALSRPYTLTEKEVTLEKNVKILVDKSDSMSFYDSVDIEKLKAYFGDDMRIQEIEIGQKSSSQIYDNILSTASSNENILLISDGNNYPDPVRASSSDLNFLLRSINTTLSIINLSKKLDEHSVHLYGPKSVVRGIDTTFVVEIKKNHKKAVEVVLYLDDEEIFRQKTQDTIIEYTHSFDEGSHSLTAIIEDEGGYRENNVFHKSISVIDKPEILFISKDSMLSGLLEYNYQVHTDLDPQEVPANIDTVIINNIKTTELSNQFQENLISFVRDGGGLIYMGGRNTYDFDSDIHKSLISSILPVKPGTGIEKDADDFNIVILMDLSPGTGDWTQEDTLNFDFTDHNSDNRKGLAITMLDRINPDYRVAVMGFDVTTEMISPLTKIRNKDLKMVKKTIENIQPQYGGNHSNLDYGIRQAQELLQNNGGGNLIIISDFDVRKASLNPNEMTTFKLAKEALLDIKELGIGLDLIGIGKKEDKKNGKFNTNEVNAIAFAVAGGGRYHPLEEYQSVTFEFKDNPSIKKATSDKYYLDFLTANHFITAGLQTDNLVIYGYNQVIPKRNGVSVVGTTSGIPIIVTSQTGLGRVVSFATDDGSGWANELLSGNNSRLFVRTVNYCIGNPATREEEYVSVPDGHIGQQIKVTVKSPQYPAYQDMTFVRVQDSLYTSSITPDNIGYFNLLGEPYAVNYNPEFEDVTQNTELDSIVYGTGGKIFKSTDESKIAEFIVSKSLRVETVRQYYTAYIIIAVLIAYCLGAYIRRLIVNLGL
ncbi:VWA domain-containing protein [Candidatus Woesearchaeota archaeon]|nr:VWA domain-containing protein [Candidatus Woesearchaeota archaeon]